MNKEEARAILAAELDSLTALPYEDLISQLPRRVRKVSQGPSGTQYNVRIRVGWYAKSDGIVQFSGEVDDDGWGFDRRDMFMQRDGSLRRRPPLMTESDRRWILPSLVGLALFAFLLENLSDVGAFVLIGGFLLAASINGIRERRELGYEWPGAVVPIVLAVAAYVALLFWARA